MKVAILGFDVEGRASYDYFAAQGHELAIHDQKNDIEVPANAVSILGDGYLDNLDQYDLLVRTAGLAPQKIIDKNPGVSNKITSHVNQFFEACPTTNIIGVTGTKGKGTTSTLIAKMLEAAGKDVKLGGNIGLPPLTFLNQLNENSWVVLELSSFQLIDLRQSPHIAICLMVVPEHLNWHRDADEYFSAKAQLFGRQATDDIAIYYAGSELSKKIVAGSAGHKIPYGELPGATVENNNLVIDGQIICGTAELGLKGRHNWQNACAAVTAVWQADQNIDAIRSVLTDFTGLEHRLEYVRELGGVSYYDDSFGTTPETAIVALQAFEQPKVIILGGSDKGADYTELAKAVIDNNVRSALLIGDQASRIQQALEVVGFTNFAVGGSNMAEVVGKARSQAQPGDVVLLSTATASFDMFKNYKDRGEQFKRAVQELV